MDTLKKRAQFLAVAKDGTSVATKGLVLQALSQSTISSRPLQVGFTVSKKLGNAVIRNRIRRRLKAVTSKVLQRGFVPTMHYVIIGRKAALDREFEMLEKDLIYAIHTVKRQQTIVASPEEKDSATT